MPEGARKAIRVIQFHEVAFDHFQGIHEFGVDQGCRELVFIHAS